MKVAKLTVLVWILFQVVLPLSELGADVEYTGELPPVEIGGSCNNYNLSYIWTTQERTPWSIKKLIAFPSSLSSSEDWDQTDNFIQTISTYLPPSPTAADYASACVSTWNEFITGTAHVEVVLDRVLSTTKQSIVCDNNAWVAEVNEQSSVQDSSEAIRISPEEGYQIYSMTTDDLLAEFSATLDFYNSQAGADTRPNHSYEEQSN